MTREEMIKMLEESTLTQLIAGDFSMNHFITAHYRDKTDVQLENEIQELGLKSSSQVSRTFKVEVTITLDLDVEATSILEAENLVEEMGFPEIFGDAENINTHIEAYKCQS